MPTIQIPIGGQMVNVEVNDLASENTLQNISAKANQQADLLGRIATSVGATTVNTQQLEEVMKKSSNNVSQSGGQIASATSKSLKEPSQRQKESLQQTANATKKLFADLEGMTAAQLAQTLGNIIPGAIGSAIGSVLGGTVGMLEKFGAALSTARRVGVGFLLPLALFF